MKFDYFLASQNMQVAYQLPHTLSVHSYKTPTVCKVCDKLLMGLIKQGMKCRDCKVRDLLQYRFYSYCAMVKCSQN